MTKEEQRLLEYLDGASAEVVTVPEFGDPICSREKDSTWIQAGPIVMPLRLGACWNGEGEFQPKDSAWATAEVIRNPLLT